MMMTNFESIKLKDIRRAGIDLKKRYSTTENALDKMKIWRLPKDADADIFNSKLRFQLRLSDFRKRITPNTDNSEVDLSVEEVSQYYNYITRVLLDDLSNAIRSSNGSSTWRFLISYKNMLRAVENIGIEMSLGLRFFARGTLTNGNKAKFIEHQKLAVEYLSQSELFATDLREDIAKVRNGTDFDRFIRTYNDLSRVENVNFTSKDEKISKIFRYFESSVSVMESLRIIVGQIRKVIQDTMTEEFRSANKDFSMTVLLLIVVVIISPMILILVKTAIQAVQILSNGLRANFTALKHERKRSEKLLYQMLPPIVADAMKNQKKTSWLFESATVFFSEIDEFKAIARDCRPLELFQLLNIIYKTFDERIDVYDVYKVETINDSYMVASGLPQKNGDKHASEIANLALDLQNITPTIVVPHDTNRRLQIRMGIHSGATIAGVRLIMGEIIVVHL